MALEVALRELAEVVLVVWHWNGGFGCEIGVETSLVVGLRPQRHHRQNRQLGVQSLLLQASLEEVGILCVLLLLRLTSCGSVVASTAGGTEEMGSAPAPGKWARPFAVEPGPAIPGQSSV